MGVLRVFIGGLCIGIGARLWWDEVQDAVQERKAKTLHVRKAPEDSEEVGEGNEAQEEVEHESVWVWREAARDAFQRMEVYDALGGDVAPTEHV